MGLSLAPAAVVAETQANRTQCGKRFDGSPLCSS